MWVFNNGKDFSELKKEESLLGRRNKRNLDKKVGKHRKYFRDI